MPTVSPQIEESWKNVLQNQFESQYFQELKQFLIDERKNHHVFPPGSRIFAAFDSVPFHKVKVVIIGQDPYHGPGQANGFCFSVNRGVTVPPSLKNIYKELHSDLNIPVPAHGDLSAWTEQGVLLLNAVLTVRARQPQSHQGRGWETFTDYAIKQLSEQRKNIVFLLWGRSAQNKMNLIDTNRHFVLKAAHPSPYSANKGFYGCRHFSKANTLLQQTGQNPVDWTIK
ncbi:MAG: uracil-DNA glycosylase [Bacteroidota bacterium]